jgi:hypothetical protein
MVGLMKAAKSVILITYPGVGHMAVHEAPEQTVSDARAFFDAPVSETPAAAPPG